MVGHLTKLELAKRRSHQVTECLWAALLSVGAGWNTSQSAHEFILDSFRLQHDGVVAAAR